MFYWVIWIWLKWIVEESGGKIRMKGEGFGKKL